MAMENYWHVGDDLGDDLYSEKENVKKKEPVSDYENKIGKSPEHIIVSLIPEFGMMSQLVLQIFPEGKFF